MDISYGGRVCNPLAVFCPETACRTPGWASHSLLYFCAAEHSTVPDADQVLLSAFWTIEQKIFKDRVPAESHSGFSTAGGTKKPACFVIAHPNHLLIPEITKLKEPAGIPSLFGRNPLVNKIDHSHFLNPGNRLLQRDSDGTIYNQ